IDVITGVISTAVGDGTFGVPVNGASARSTIGFPQGIAFDAQGDLVVAGSDLLRVSPGADGLVRGDADESISVIAGCHTNCQQPFGGDGLPITHPQVFFGFIGSISVAPDGALLLSDYYRIRRIAPGADGIVTGAADEVIQTIGGYYDATGVVTNFNGDSYATQSDLSPMDFVVQDGHGQIIVVDGNNYRVRRFGFIGGSTGGTDADLSVSATASLSSAGIGQQIQYTVTVTNNGPASATGVSLTLAPSTGFVLDSVQPLGPCVLPLPGGIDPVRCDGGTLAAGQQVTFSFAVTPLSPGTLSAMFAVVGQGTDPQPANNAATVDVDIEPGADLGVSIVAPAGGATVNVGSALTFDVVMTNLGPSSAFVARLRWALPPALAFVSATIPGGTCDFSSGVVVCDVEPLAAGASPHATIVVRPTAAGPITSVFDVSSPLYDGNPANNSAAIAITADSLPAVITIQESIIVSDAAAALPSTLIGVVENIVISDSGVGNAPIVLPSTMIGIAEQIIVSDDARLDTGATLVLAPATATGPLGAPHTVTAIAADSSDESARVVVSLHSATNMRVQFADPGAVNSPLSVSTAQIAPGAYNIVVTLATDSTGALSSTAAQVVAALNAAPAASSLITAQTWPGNAGTGVVRPRALSSLTTVGFSIGGTTTLSTSCATMVPGVCSISYAGGAPGTDVISAYLDLNGNSIADSGEPSATAQKIWTPQPDLTIAKALVGSSGPVSTMTVDNGAIVRYRLTVSNAGAGATQGSILVTDTFTSALTFVSAGSDARCTAIGQAVQCQWAGPLPAGQAESFDILAQVGASVAPVGGSVQIANQALVSTPGQSDMANDGSNLTLLTVRSRDVVPPVLNLEDLTREATGPGGASVIFVATAVDNIDGPVPVTCVPASGSTFPLGTRPVDCSATDAAGNTATGRFNVTVIDTTPPGLTLPANIVTAASSASGSAVSYTATASDLVSGAVAVGCLPASGSTFAVGTTTVACSATDAAGNHANGSFTVTVNAFTVPGTAQLLATATFTKNAAGQYVATVTVRNTGTAAATVVQLTTALLNSTAGTPPPLAFGSVAPGASVVHQLTFAATAGSAGAGNVLRMSLNWTGGAASFSQRAILP
ncbi:MAG: HYR domain-containing protein, partial [Vicinamibacterales bacterium]